MDGEWLNLPTHGLQVLMSCVAEPICLACERTYLRMDFRCLCHVWLNLYHIGYLSCMQKNLPMHVLGQLWQLCVAGNYEILFLGHLALLELSFWA